MEKENFKLAWRNLSNSFYQVLKLSYKNKKLIDLYTSTAKRAIDLFNKYNCVYDFKNLSKLLVDH